MWTTGARDRFSVECNRLLVVSYVQKNTAAENGNKFALRKEGRKEGNSLFNDALNTFYLQLYGVGHMVKDHSDSERGNPLPPHGLFFPISSKGSFICIIP